MHAQFVGLPLTQKRMPADCAGPGRSSGKGTDVLCWRAGHGGLCSSCAAQCQAEGSGTSAARHAVQQQDDNGCSCWGGCQQRQQCPGRGQPQPPAWDDIRPQAPESCRLICNEPALPKDCASLGCTWLSTISESEAGIKAAF